MAHGKSWMVRAKRCWPACYPCFDAYRRDLKKQAYRKERGLTEGRIHSGKSTLLVREMINIYGRRQYWVAEKAGISKATIKRLHAGTGHDVWPSTERKLQALHEKTVMVGKTDGGLKANWVPAGTSILAIKGLMAQGWTQPWIAEQIGSGQRSVSALVGGRQKYVTPKREKELLDLVRRVGSTDGGSTRTKRLAERNGWQPTMYYDVLV